MTTPAELLGRYTSQSQLDSYFLEKVGILSVLSYADSASIQDGVTSAFDAFTDTLAAVPTEGGIIFVPTTSDGSTYVIDDDITFPDDVVLWFAEGANIKRTSGATITLNCGIFPTLGEIFTDDTTGAWAGTIIANWIQPEWFSGVYSGVSVYASDYLSNLNTTSKDIVGAINEVDAAGAGGLATHLADLANPHVVTPVQVNCIAKDSEIVYTPTADYHPSTKKYVDDEITTTTNYVDSETTATLLEVNSGVDLYAVTTGSANAYVATFTTPYLTYATGLTLRVKFNLENTTTSTINVDTLGVKTIKKVTGAGIEVLEAGDIVADGVYVVVYNGTDFILSNQFKIKPMIQVFTASGTFTAPFTGNYKVIVTGGGGSGGKGSNGGSGGGAGGTAIKVVSITKGVVETVTVGAGAAEQTINDTNGITGGTSSFGAHCSATGGQGGGFSVATLKYGNLGGIGTGGDINIRGEMGGVGFDADGGNTVLGQGGCSYYGGMSNGVSFVSAYGAGGRGVTNSSSGVSPAGEGLVVVEWMEG